MAFHLLLHLQEEVVFFQKPADSKSNLTLTATNVALSVIFEGEDYGLKAGINSEQAAALFRGPLERRVGASIQCWQAIHF